MPITLDPSAALLAKLMKEAGRPALDTLPPPEARAQSATNRAAVQPDPPTMQSVEDISVPAPHGAIPIRVFTPLTLAKNDLAAGLIYYHGGGWVLGDLDGYDVVCREIATKAGFIVVSVDYRLAPEHKFPAAVDDCIAATDWVARNAAKLGIDADRLFIGGDSAGGNLAAVVSMHARDNNGAQIKGQVLVYPVTDLAMNTASYADAATGVLLTHAMMRWFRDHYLTDHKQIDDWRASPLRMANLKGLPPAYVATCGADPLHDEGEEFARRLKHAGNDVIHVNYPGQFHAFLTMGRLLPEANKLVGEITGWLKQQAA